jgi:hypothetical protein
VTCQSLPPTQSLIGFLDISIGSGKGRVPWSRLRKAQGDYIKTKYLPEDIVIKQFYHLCLDEVKAILEHWAKRQDSGKVPFRFRKGAKKIQQNEPNLEENDSGTRSDEDLEDDLEGDNNMQVTDDSGSDSGEQAHSLGNAAGSLGGVKWLLKHSCRIR